jgi:hypothetical protein
LQGQSSWSGLFGLFLFFLDFDNFATFVKPTIGTDGMGKAHRAAVRAGRQVTGLQSVVRAAHIAAALRVFALWMWGHSTYSLMTVGMGGHTASSHVFLLRMKRADYIGRIEVRQGMKIPQQGKTGD